MTDEGVTDDGYIVDAPLPDAVNFDVLKSEGIARLKALAGQTWTNFNESDPGVTILDQLCYALTELGYCAQFPVEDVLTGADGTIDYDGQFFRPEEILTCSPVTPDDYRKLVLDQVEEVRAVYIQPETSPTGAGPTGRYRTHFCTADGSGADDVGPRIYALLNQHRNLGERFLAPQPLAPLAITLRGTVWLARGADAAAVQASILQLLREYEAPQVVQSGYLELRDQGLAAGDIFNGPALLHGWIATPPAGKRDTVSLFELNALVAALDGVSHVEGLAFDGRDGDEVAVGEDELPALVPGPGFHLQGDTQPAQPHHGAALYLGSLRASHDAASVEAQVDTAPALPTGHYRDIEQYYSVQNTFPDIYGIGPNSLQSDAPSYRVASARQLKGYLLVYDQLLANEFAQLAHVGALFSFASAKQRPKDPGDWPLHRKFCTTYYSQPLYDVPDVQALLRGNESFHYELDPARPARQLEREAWKRYRQFPFNEYIHGLGEITEREHEAVRRRDAMLTHLMARHGDDAAEYHPLIKAGHWYGSEGKTRVIAKTIWLQNFRLLSCYRTVGFNWQTADALKAPHPFAHGDKPVQPGPGEPYPMADGLLDQDQIFEAARVDEDDLRNFSAFELKLAILLGLPAHLQALADKLAALLGQSAFLDWLRAGGDAGSSYLLPDSDLSVLRGADKHQLLDGQQCLMDIGPVSAEPIGEHTYRVHADQLAWLATQRKGCLLVEHILLLPDTAPGSAGYFLGASLVLPAYVSLFQQPSFRAGLQALVELHWPAHLRLQTVDASCALLKPLIPLFVQWHNWLKRGTAAAATGMPNPAPALARLLEVEKGAGNGS